MNIFSFSDYSRKFEKNRDVSLFGIAGNHFNFAPTHSKDD